MNLALFFEGTGQGVAGKRTNVTRVYEACSQEDQKLHLEAGPGTRPWYYLSGKVAGRDWQKIFQSARRWFESEYSRASTPTPQDYTSPKVFLFGFSRGALLARHFAAWLDKLGIAVEYLGVWDTVDATPGLDVSEACPTNVKRARHAVAEHEARRFFAYVPLTGEQVEEELFPGVHSDVGGFYDDNHEYADVACAWVVRPALVAGLRLERELGCSESVNPLTAIRHDSQRLVSNLFGLLKPVTRAFPERMKRHSEICYTTQYYEENCR